MVSLTCKISDLDLLEEEKGDDIVCTPGQVDAQQLLKDFW